MRHFAEAQRAAGRRVLYRRLDEEGAAPSLSGALYDAIEVHKPQEILMVRPGDYRVKQSLEGAAHAAGGAISYAPDRHFICGEERLAELRAGRKRFVLEDFYRAERKRTGWLMEDGQDGSEPAGGQWNFDKDNRQSFGKDGPGLVPRRASFPPDDITQDVLKMVEREFGDAPGSLKDFDEPVTAEQARDALDDFIQNRLGCFGDYQDAIALGRRTLYHSRISAVMNVKLLDPRTACLAAIDAYQSGAAPLNAVEGFVRQILGWREFVRGVYWLEMPAYAEMNALGADLDPPRFLWTAQTDMVCIADAVHGLIDTGYAHHIQRLMVLGLYQLLLGVHPYRAHEWHMEMYLDAIDWVSLPNVLGMSQHADGGVVGTKPYAASGAYISRMSNACAECRYDPKEATGDNACPFTTLYWDFLARHRERFKGNHRMRMHYANLGRKDPDEVAAIRRRADALKG